MYTDRKNARMEYLFYSCLFIDIEIKSYILTVLSILFCLNSVYSIIVILGYRYIYKDNIQLQ